MSCLKYVIMAKTFDCMINKATRQKVEREEITTDCLALDACLCVNRFEHFVVFAE